MARVAGLSDSEAIRYSVPTALPTATSISIPAAGLPENSAPSNYILGHYETGWEVHPVSAWRLHH